MLTLVYLIHTRTESINMVKDQFDASAECTVNDRANLALLRYTHVKRAGDPSSFQNNRDKWTDTWCCTDEVFIVYQLLLKFHFQCT